MTALHQVVLASAGTGKTHLLTTRSIALLAMGEDPTSVLATTFTRKAAGEILERVLGRVAGAAVSEGDAAVLSAQIDVPLTRASAEALLAGTVAQLGRLGVGTIDALLLRMASVFALELGVPPGWAIVDDERDADMRYEAVERAIEGGDEGEFFSLVKLLHGGEHGRGVHEAVLDAVERGHRAYVASAHHPEAWEAIGATTNRLDDEHVAEAIGALAREAPPMTKSGTPNKNWAKALERVVRATTGGDWESFLGDTLIDKYPDQPFSRAAFPEGVVSALAPLIEHASAVVFGTLRDQNRSVRDLMARFDAAYTALKRATASYRFEDLPRLLKERPFAGELDHLYYMLDARYRHALLDEFQDTSVEQFALLEPLLDELLQSDDGRSTLFVGDVKQSLYQWREAEPELMPGLVERWGVIERRSLSENWRSSRAVLDTVNRVFATPTSLDALAELESVQKWERAYEPHVVAAQRPQDTPGLVTLSVAEVGEDESKREAVERAVADRVAEICAESAEATVGVLVRANSRIAPLMHLLAERGIDASEEGGNPLSDAPAVAVAASLLHLADHPGDSACRYHVATSPIGSLVGLGSHLDDRAARAAAAKLRARFADEGYASVLAWVLDGAGAHMTARERRRFEQLVELAEGFDETGGHSSELARIVRSRGVVDPSSTRVRLMTVHRSKGLEFDAVVLADLDGSWEPKPGDVLVRRAGVLGPPDAVTMHVKKSLRRFNAEAERVFDEARDKAIGGELCVLYVAMTRAARRLDMIVAPPGKTDESLSASRVLRAMLADGDAGPGEVYREEVGDWGDGVGGAEPTPKPEVLGLQLGRSTPTAGDPGWGLRAAVRAPSSLEGGGGVDVARLFEPEHPAATVGTIVHGLFELVGWLDDGPPGDETLEATARRLSNDQELIAQSVDLFTRALRHQDVVEVLSRARYAEWDAPSVENERSFSVLVDGGDGPSLLRGRIDRLVRCEDRIEIVDFKSDAVDPHEVEASVAYYRPQLSAYASAAEQLFGVERDAITTTLVFVRSGIVVSA